MTWYTLLGIVMVLVFLVSKLKGGIQEMGAATNALLAEHYLSHSKLNPESSFGSELKNAIFQVIRNGAFPNMIDDAATDMFNRKSRFHQLNLVAMALNEKGMSPAIEGEFWHLVSNPFRVSENTPHLDATANRLKSKIGGILELKASKLEIVNGRVVDA